MQVLTVSDFFHAFIAENCQKIGFLNLRRLFPKFFYPFAQIIQLHHKSDLGFMMLTGLPGEANESISGYVRF